MSSSRSFSTGARLLLMLDEERGLVLLPGCVRHLPTGREVTLDLLGRLFPESDRVCISQFVMPVAQDGLDTGKEFSSVFPTSSFPMQHTWLVWKWMS